MRCWQNEKFNYFLALNGIDLAYTQKELYETILDVAAGNLGYKDLLQWILEHQI